MSKHKMLAARELIKEKRYAEARAILRTVDHPTARQWLAKLDEIAPETFLEADWDDEAGTPDAAPLPDLAPVSTSGPQRAGWFSRIRCGCYLILLVIFLAWLGFGAAVSLAVRNVVQDVGTTVAEGSVPGQVDETLQDAGVEGISIQSVTDEFARFIVDGLERFGVDVQPEQTSTAVRQASQTAANTAMALTFLSVFLCPVLPVFLLVLFGFFRSVMWLR